MIDIARNGYTNEEIAKALHAESRQVGFRYELLDKEEQRKFDLRNVLSAEVSFSALAQIKRTARFSLTETAEIDFLNDRIKPWMRVTMPPVRRTEVVYEDAIGENILLNTGFLYAPTPWATTLLEVISGNPNSVLAKRNGSTAAWGVQTPKETLFKYNKTYTIRFKLKTADMTSMGYNYVISSSGNVSMFFKFSNAIISDGQWHEYAETFIFKHSDRVGGMLLASDFRNSPGESFEMKDLKVEEGATATPWAPAIADIGMEEYQEKWMRKVIRPKIVPSQDIEFPLGVFLLSSPVRKDGTGTVIRDVDAYDGLLVLRDDKFLDRHTLLEGTSYYQAIIDILTSAGIKKHNIERTDQVLKRSIEFEPGKEKLFAINELLGQINYTPVYVDTEGYYTSRYYRSPAVRSADYEYKDDELSVTFKGAEEELDLFNVPNAWTVIRTNEDQEPLVSSYINDNPDSPTSTLARGRIISDRREIDDIADQQALDDYTQRIAFEASQVYGRIRFNTALMPFHDYSNVLQLEYSPLAIKGKYLELGWTMKLQAGGQMSHEVRKITDVGGVVP